VIVKLAVLVVVAVVAGAGWISGFGRAATPSAANAPISAEPGPGEQVIRITEADLNRQLSQRLVGQPLGSTPLGAATLERITTTLADGHMVANGDAQLGSATVPVSLTASGAVQDGRALVSVDDLRAAGVPLPANARQSVQQALQAQLDDAVNQQQLRVTSISIANGALTLKGSRQ
jgi:LmeA-like phospholipid-binding